MHRLEDLLSRPLPASALATLKRSRLLTAAAWRGLRLYQDVTGGAPNALRQLETMEPALPPGGTEPAAGEEAPRVLFFSLRGWTAHLAWETTLARALHLRGAETLTVLCDKVLPACEPRTVVDDFPSTCDRCMGQSGAFLERTGLPYRWLSAYLEPGELEAATARVEGLELDALRAFEEDGVPVGRLVAASVNRHLLTGGPAGGAGGGAGGAVDPAYRAAWRRYVAAGLVTAWAARRILDRFRPGRVLVLNGLFFSEAILMHLARGRGIPVWAYERAKRLDSLVFARDEPVVSQSFDARWERRRGEPLTREQSEALDAYVASRVAGNVGIERLWAEKSDAGEEGGPGAAAGEGDGAGAGEPPPTAALFTNVLWDTAMFESDVAFPSMIDWILHAIRWFGERPGRRLVVRVHPAEVRVPFKRSRDRVVDRIRAALPVLPDNVRVVAPEETLDSYGLLARSDVVLAYASTIGLEAALEGKPTVVAGRTHYRGRGFTLDPEDPAAWDRALEQAFEGGRLDPERVERARRYAYLYFFEEIIPFPLVHEEPRSHVTFRYRTGDDLAPGRDRSLDAICRAILDGAPLRNPAA